MGRHVIPNRGLEWATRLFTCEMSSDATRMADLLTVEWGDTNYAEIRVYSEDEELLKDAIRGRVKGSSICGCLKQNDQCVFQTLILHYGISSLG